MENSYYNAFMSKKEENTPFGKKLREARMTSGYTQEELAKLSGVSRRMIVHYETYGKKPDIDKIKKIARVLRISADHLIGISETTKSKKLDDLSYKVMKKVRIIEKLPARDQNTVFSLINAL